MTWRGHRYDLLRGQTGHDNFARILVPSLWEKGTLYVGGQNEIQDR